MDTHLLLWAATGSDRLTPFVRDYLGDVASEPVFSVASLWEVVIKSGLGRADFTVSALALREGLLTGGYGELSITAPHTLAVGALPPVHGDPFDRMLIAQASVEGCPLLTADSRLAEYGAPVRMV
ncbi:type II toxin-antitoxin system VapC family toxin [Jannaschia pohangensis]|uniref:type II toxin-antitoxin system VapC family toxin n=1 Tax=Jannaschia pohangensis TaxID=390807 RepID=UPI001FE19144|nr:type II toxin-antitoxin system VapC family toxin [Jannaschia pohangensis]